MDQQRKLKKKRNKTGLFSFFPQLEKLKSSPFFYFFCLIDKFFWWFSINIWLRNRSDISLETLFFVCRIFDSGDNESCETKVPSTTELKTKPDGWETTSKVHDGNIWDISQREEDILLQEFERRIAFSKYQVPFFYHFQCWHLSVITVMPLQNKRR